MKGKLSKKIVVFLVLLSSIISVVPISAFATQADTTPVAQTEESGEDTDFNEDTDSNDDDWMSSTGPTAGGNGGESICTIPYDDSTKTDVPSLGGEPHNAEVTTNLCKEKITNATAKKTSDSKLKITATLKFPTLSRGLYYSDASKVSVSLCKGVDDSVETGCGYGTCETTRDQFGHTRIKSGGKRGVLGCMETHFTSKSGQGKYHRKYTNTYTYVHPSGTSYSTYNWTSYTTQTKTGYLNDNLYSLGSKTINVASGKTLPDNISFSKTLTAADYKKVIKWCKNFDMDTKVVNGVTYYVANIAVSYNAPVSGGYTYAGCQQHGQFVYGTHACYCTTPSSHSETDNASSCTAVSKGVVSGSVGTRHDKTSHVSGGNGGYEYINNPAECRVVTYGEILIPENTTPVEINLEDIALEKDGTTEDFQLNTKDYAEKQVEKGTQITVNDQWGAKADYSSRGYTYKSTNPGETATIEKDTTIKRYYVPAQYTAKCKDRFYKNGVKVAEVDNTITKMIYHGDSIKGSDWGTTPPAGYSTYVYSGCTTATCNAAPVTVYRDFELGSFTLRYHANYGSTDTYVDQKVYVGESCVLKNASATEPWKRTSTYGAGYWNNVGWSTGSGATNSVVYKGGSTQTFNVAAGQIAHLYAVWQPSLNVKWDYGVDRVMAFGTERKSDVATFHTYNTQVTNVGLALKNQYHLQDVKLNGLGSAQIVAAIQQLKPITTLTDGVTVEILTAQNAQKPTKAVYKSGTTTNVNGCVVSPGDKLDYTVTITNGTVVPRDVIITDTLDEGVTYVTGSADNGGVYADGTLTWNISQLAAGASRTVKFTVKVNETKVGGEIRNFAETTEKAIALLGETADLNEQSNIVNNYVMEEPEKHIRKTATSEEHIDNTILVEGDSAVYTIAVENPAPTDKVFNVTDKIPEGLNVKSISDNGKATGQTVAWENITVGAKKTKVLHVTVEVNDKAQGKTLVNKATAKCTDAFGTSRDSNEVTNYGMKAPEKSAYLTLNTDLTTNTTMENIDRRVINDGILVTYRIKWQNPTNAERSLVLKDTIPEYARIATAADLDRASEGINLSEEFDYSNGGNYLISDNGTYDEATKTITWNLESEDAVGEEKENGFVEFSVVILKTAQDLQVTNKATLTVLSPTGVNENNPTMESNVVVNPVLKTPDKIATRSDGQDVTDLVVNDGEEITYKITFKNPADEVKDFIVTDVIPEFTKLVSGSISDDGTYDADKNMITWEIKGVEAKAEKTVSFTVMVLEEAQNNTVKNTARVYVDDADKVTKDNTPTKIYILEDPKKAVLNLDGEDINGITKRVGDIITYNIIYKNPADSERIATVTDELPDGVEFVSAGHQGSYDVETGEFVDVSGAYSYDYNKETNTIVWTVPTAAHCQEMVSVDVRIKEGTENTILHNTASVYIPDATKKTNEVVTPVVDNPVKKSYDDAGQDLDGNFVTVGEEITYEITIENPADEAKEGFVTDTLPTGVDFVSADNKGRYDEATHTVLWKNIPLEPHQKLTINLRVRVNESAASETIHNEVVYRIDEAVVSSELTDGGEGGPISYVTTKYSLNKKGEDIDKHVVTKNNIITYKISYKNITDKERYFTIYDILPEGLEIIDIGDNGVIVKNPIEGLDDYKVVEGRTVAWQFYVPAGQEGYVTVTAKVVTNDAITLYNNATIMVDDKVEGEKPFIIDTNIVENPVIPTPVKTVFNESGVEITDKMVTTGDRITYKITYENPSDETKLADIKDALPNEVKFIGCDYDGVYDSASHSVKWTGIETEGHQKVTVSVMVQVKDSAAGKTIRNKGYVLMDEAVVSTRAKTADSDPDDPEPSDKETVDNYVACKKSYDINGNDITDEIVKVGDTLTYRIKYKNTSSIEKHYTIKDTLPEEVDYVSATGEPAVEGRILTWTFTAGAGAEGYVDVVVTVNDKGYGKKIENKADITEYNPESGDDPYTITTSACVNYVFDDDDFVKSVKDKSNKDMDGAIVPAGSNLYYYITLKNPSENKETFTVTDKLPDEVKYVSCTEGGTYDKETHTITWKLELEKSATAELEICVKLKNTVQSDTIKNMAHVVTEGTEADSNEVITYVFDEPVKSMKVGARTLKDGEKVAADTLVTFVIEYSNPTEEEREIVITDVLDKNIAGRVMEISDNGSLENGVITWYLDAAPNSSGEVSFTISSPSLDGVKITNTANVSFVDEDLLGTTSYDTNTVYYIATLDDGPLDEGGKPENNIVKTGDPNTVFFGW